MGEIEDKKNIISSGNDEIDKKLGEGIPLGSLVLIEGENDTGKSVFCQQMVYGGLNQLHRIAYYSTENTVKSMLAQMDSLSLISRIFTAGGISGFFRFTLKVSNGLPSK